MDFDRALENRGPGLVFVHPGIVDNVFSVCLRAFVPLRAPCGVRVRHPLVFSVFFLPFLLPAAYTTPSKGETKQKNSPKPLYVC